MTARPGRAASRGGLEREARRSREAVDDIAAMTQRVGPADPTIHDVMMMACQTDQLASGPGTTWMETAVHVANGMVVGRTRMWTERRFTTVQGAVRVLALDVGGEVLGFTGEARFRVGGRTLPVMRSQRTFEWSSALFAPSLDGAVRLEVVQYRPPRRWIIGRPAAQA